MPRISKGKYLAWRLTEEPYKPNIDAERVFRNAVSVTVSSNGYGSRIELTPEQAREFAAVVVELADLAEKEAS